MFRRSGSLTLSRESKQNKQIACTLPDGRRPAKKRSMKFKGGQNSSTNSPDVFEAATDTSHEASEVLDAFDARSAHFAGIRILDIGTRISSSVPHLCSGIRTDVSSLDMSKEIRLPHQIPGYQHPDPILSSAFM